MNSYDPCIFDGLPAVDVAATEVKSQNGDQLVKTAIRELFIKHDVRNELGVALVHRHFDLKSDEIMVDYQGVATPWNAGRLDHYVGFGKVLPLSYIVVDGEPRPYEFYFTTDPSEEPPKVPADFLVEWEGLMKHNKLEGLLGIRALRKAISTSHMREFTQRFAAFTVPWEWSPSSSVSEGVYQTSWSFRVNENGDDEPNDHCSTHTKCDHFINSCFHRIPPRPKFRMEELV